MNLTWIWLRYTYIVDSSSSTQRTSKSWSNPTSTKKFKRVGEEKEEWTIEKHSASPSAKSASSTTCLLYTSPSPRDGLRGTPPTPTIRSPSTEDQHQHLFRTQVRTHWNQIFILLLALMMEGWWNNPYRKLLFVCNHFISLSI